MRVSYDSVRGASREYSTHIQKFRATLSCATLPQSVPPKRGLSWFVILELPMSDAPDFLADLSPRIASTFFDQFGDQFLHVNSVVPNYDQVVSSNGETLLLASIRQPFWCTDTDIEGFFTRSSSRTHHRTDPEASILGVCWGMEVQPVHVRSVNSFYLCRYHLISRCPFEIGRPPATTSSSNLACTNRARGETRRLLLTSFGIALSLMGLASPRDPNIIRFTH